MQDTLTPTVANAILSELRAVNTNLLALCERLEQSEKSPDDLILSKEAARLLGWKVGTSDAHGIKLRQLYRDGQLRKAVPGRPWRFHRGEILQYKKREIMGL